MISNAGLVFRHPSYEQSGICDGITRRMPQPLRTHVCALFQSFLRRHNEEIRTYHY